MGLGRRAGGVAVSPRRRAGGAAACEDEGGGRGEQPGACGRGRAGRGGQRAALRAFVFAASFGEAAAGRWVTDLDGAVGRVGGAERFDVVGAQIALLRLARLVARVHGGVGVIEVLRVRDAQKVARLVGDDGLQVVERAGRLVERELVERRVDLDVGVFDLARVDVVRDRGLRDRVVDVRVLKVGVAKDDGVRVRPFSVELLAAARDVVELRERHARPPAARALDVDPGEEGALDRRTQVGVRVVAAEVALKAEADAGAAPEERLALGAAGRGVEAAVFV